MHNIHTFKVIFSFRTSKIMTTDMWRVYVNIFKVYILIHDFYNRLLRAEYYGLWAWTFCEDGRVLRLFFFFSITRSLWRGDFNSLGNKLLLILFQAMFDIWSAEGALSPRLAQTRCPGLWPHAHCSLPAAGERMIEGPLRGTWVPGSAGSDLAGNRAQWQSTLCCGGKFPSVKMPWIVRAHAGKPVCAGVHGWCSQSS